MDVGQIPLLAMLKERMDWLNRRQDVLSQNVAGADMPGYAARDLKPLDFEAMLKNSARASAVGLVTTDPRHIVSTRADGGFEETSAPAGGSNGGAVSLEAEMIKVADTQAQFQAATNLYAKAIDMMKTAIGRPGS